eukprot:g21006.t1
MDLSVKSVWSEDEERPIHDQFERLKDPRTPFVSLIDLNGLIGHLVLGTNSKMTADPADEGFSPSSLTLSPFCVSGLMSSFGAAAATCAGTRLSSATPCTPKRFRPSTWMSLRRWRMVTVIMSCLHARKDASSLSLQWSSS